MNLFDSSIIHIANNFSQHSWLFDKILHFISGSNLWKGVVFSTIFVWLWFKDDAHESNARKHITATILSCAVAMLIARMMALTLPFRLRPLHEYGSNFVLPYGMDKGVLDGWNSFPSDHAVLFFTLSTGLLYISRKLGIFALIYTTIFIALPRVYLGLHYPTDIICGALLGILIAWIGNQSIILNKISKPILLWGRSKPSLFYSLFFLIINQISEMFDSSRDIIHASMAFMKHFFNS